MTAQVNNRPGLSFVVKWIAAFVIASIVSSLLMLAIMFVAQYIQISALLAVLLMALVMGAVLGAGQGFIMLPYLDRSELWIGLTALGYAIGFIVPSLLKLDPLLRYAAIGLALGLLQWWMLRRYVEAAGWWIVVNFACWLIAGMFDQGALLYSPVSGFVMMWLLNHRKQSIQVTPAVTQVN
jgi:serine/threonine-protein kinase